METLNKDLKWKHPLVDDNLNGKQPPAMLRVSLTGWDNDEEPGNQVPTKSSYSTEIFHRSPAF